MFNVARDEWELPIGENPLAKLQFKASDQRRGRRLKLGELDKIIEATESCRNPLIRLIIRFALEAGMRRGEILAITKQHIDYGSRSLFLRETKNQSSVLYSTVGYWEFL